jgi:molybdopterin synthase sulfur carrier subunit
MMITVKFFATFRDLSGTGELQIQIAKAATVAKLIEQIEQQYPQFERKLENLALVALNEKYTHRQQQLQHNDVVAFFPPVSGG